MQQKETMQERVYKDILARIYEGEFPDGSPLPTLAELRSRYHAGDNCVRAVVARLNESGYLSTQRGRPARVVFHPDQAVKALPLFSCDKKKLRSFFWAIHILFPSIYTHASMACTGEQLNELSHVMSLLPAARDSCMDFVELNIRFANIIISSLDNDLILYIVQTVMQNTLLPAALIQVSHDLLAEEFLLTPDIMNGIYTAIVKKDPAAVKAQWTQLFRIAESIVQKATVATADIHMDGYMELAVLRYTGEYRYMLIAHNLYEKILDGIYTVGSFLPTISEMQALYSASKVTIQSACRILARLGIIEIIHGRGSKVVRLCFGNLPTLDNEVFNRKKREYLKTIEFLQIVCEDIILQSNGIAFGTLKDRMEGELNPSHCFSPLILCKSLMKYVHAPALDIFYRAIGRSLHFSQFLLEAHGGLIYEENHSRCMAIVDAMEKQHTHAAVAQTQELLSVLYLSATQARPSAHFDG